jgi:hypothetical protein
MGTDWFIKVECPYPNRESNSREERVKACSGCPYVIWEEPVTMAGFMKSMCGVRVGRIGRAAKLDDIGEELTGIPRFTKEEAAPAEKLAILEKIRAYTEEAAPAEKLAILEKIRAYTEETRWRLQGFSAQETLEHLERLIEFCKRAEEKDLKISVWA